MSFYNPASERKKKKEKKNTGCIGLSQFNKRAESFPLHDRIPMTDSPNFFAYKYIYHKKNFFFFFSTSWRRIHRIFITPFFDRQETANEGSPPSRNCRWHCNELANITCIFPRGRRLYISDHEKKKQNGQSF